MSDEGHSRRSPRSSRNSDNSLLKSLKTDWQMFWHGLVGDDAAEPEAFVTGRLEVLTLEQIKELTKVLSADRKKLNQKLESIQKEIDLNSAKLESLKLVGGNHEETLDRLNFLNDLGQKMNHELGQLNDKLKLTRGQEDRLKKSVN